MVKF
ncbi:hypothetical protein LINPERHAP2_LOCUS35237 [Linum perenne]|jgi:NAD+-dependent protein deacetylase SIR2